MSQLIADIWKGLRDAGMPEVMLYLPDHSASRCHWDDTTVIGGIRVALIADQERKIVRLLPVDSCTGIGVASPKGIDPSGFKGTVQGKLSAAVAGRDPSIEDSVAGPTPEPAPMPEPAPAPAPTPEPAAVVIPPARPPIISPAPEPARVDPLANRWGGLPKQGSRFGAPPSTS